MTNFKQLAVLAMMVVGMGLLAGLLVSSFDSTPHRKIMIVLLTVLVLLNIVLIYIAYKRGRLGGIEL